MRRCYGVKRVFIKSRCRHGRLWELEGGLEMPKWNPSTGIRIEPRCSPTRIRIEWDPKGIQMESNWNLTGIEMGSKGDSNGLHMEPNNPNGIRMESKWNSSPSGHWGQLGATAAHWRPLGPIWVDWHPLGATEVHLAALVWNSATGVHPGYSRIPQSRRSCFMTTPRAGVALTSKYKVNPYFKTLILHRH